MNYNTRLRINFKYKSYNIACDFFAIEGGHGGGHGGGGGGHGGGHGSAPVKIIKVKNKCVKE